MVRRGWQLAWLLALGAVLFLVGVLASPPQRTSGSSALLSAPLAPDVADALIRRRTITPEVDTGLPIRTDGRHVSMSGAFACDPGENWEVSADLTQEGSRGAGRSQGTCRGDIQEWVVRAVGESGSVFDPGQARACAVLRTLEDTAETDRHQWCNNVVLTAAGAGGTASDDDESVLSWVALGVGAVAVLVAFAALLRPRRGA